MLLNTLLFIHYYATHAMIIGTSTPTKYPPHHKIPPPFQQEDVDAASSVVQRRDDDDGADEGASRALINTRPPSPLPSALHTLSMDTDDMAERGRPDTPASRQDPAAEEEEEEEEGTMPTKEQLAMLAAAMAHRRSKGKKRDGAKGGMGGLLGGMGPWSMLNTDELNLAGLLNVLDGVVWGGWGCIIKYYYHMMDHQFIILGRHMLFSLCTG